MKVWIFLCVLQPKQHNRWTIEAHVRIQLSSIKLDIKESCKNATLIPRFWGEGANMVNFHKTVLFISTFEVYSLYDLFLYFLHFYLSIYVVACFFMN